MNYKIDPRPILTLIITGIIVSIVLIDISSCDTAKKAIKHHNKAVELGYVYSCDTTFIDVPVIVKGKDGKDSLIYVPKIVPCPEQTPPKTKTEIKYEYKTLKEVDRHTERMYQNETKRSERLNKHLTRQIKSNNAKDKYIAKLNKQIETANNKTWNIWAVVVGLICLVLLAFKFKP